MTSILSGPPPRIIAHATGADPLDALEQASRLGFAQILLGEPAPTIAVIRRAHQDFADAGVGLWLTLSPHEAAPDDEIVAQFPDAFAIRRSIADGPVDPRRIRPARGRALARFDCPDAPALIEWWAARVAALAAAGASGFLCRRPDAIPPAVWSRLRRAAPGCAFLADTLGLDRAALPGLAGAGFDLTLSSLPWWDGRASWFIEEHRALVVVGPAITPVALPGAGLPEPAARLRLIQLALATGSGWMMPAGFADNPAVAKLAHQANLRFAAAGASDPVTLRAMTGPGAAVGALLRTQGNEPHRALLTLIQHGPEPATADPALIARAVAGFVPADGDAAARLDTPLAPGEVRLIPLAASPVVSAVGRRRAAEAACDHPRIIIDGVSPSAGRGGFAVKRVVGDIVTVEADIFADGHEQIAARVQFKAEDERSWNRVGMRPLPNDRWRAEFPLSRIGRHAFAVEAWIDSWGAFVRDLGKKRAGGLSLTLEIQEALALIETARSRAKGRTAQILAQTQSSIAAAGGEAEKLDLLLSPELRRAMAEADDRPFRISSAIQPIEVEREAARFASWYELFPRSQTDDASRPGTLRDVIGRLPAIRDMGFDVLYFPPIHPIGRTNRKGRNNSLTAGPDDPGSPYAIGAAAGGHEAIAPELGTLDDFRALLSAARDHGIELALDFAIQCSPDHPWLKNHPGWFAWRPDGSLKYAENPPKKYEDIVNVDFYAPASIPDLWNALRDVVLGWAAEGVKIFRVDNPHTKPLPFWRWLIAEVRAIHPDAIFLAEAFTRPKPMYELARLGFSQSYTYFTWRNAKAELTQYLTELTTTEVREYFRPHFFVNTPDINPYFLQRSGRAGFLIRAALAATLSGLWGMYSGFEICEAEPLPGREEYKDSEKYEIRPRDWRRPGNIVAEISALNRIRKAEPALQTHLNVTFYNAFNDHILYFGKTAPGQSDRILVAISLDPHQLQECDFEVPLWEWGLPDDAEADAADLLRGNRAVWRGKIQHLRLTPDAPYAIWRVTPRDGL